MCTTTNNATTQTFEDKIRQYAALFDGTKKDFSEVEAIFDNLYHEDFVATFSNENKLDKETFSPRHSYSLMSRALL